MAANRFDQAAQMPVINTYVPIDFDQLYRIGATQKAAVDQAAKEFGAALEKFGEFYSPSQIDTNNWYNLTINRRDIQDLLNRMTTDPDAMKDAGFRSSLAGAINRTDYAALSRLRQSREGLLQRQEANQRLMLAGRYNPLLHDVDYSNYNTLASGIFNDVSPLPYTSVVEMVKPYVDNLEDSFMGVRNGWIHRGVTPERTDQQIQANWSNIVNTPGYSQNLELIMRQNPNMSAQQAADVLNSQIILAGREFTRDNAERDPWSLYVAKKQYEYAHDPDQQSAMKNLTDLVHDDLKRQFRLNIIQNSNIDPELRMRFINQGFVGMNAEERKQIEPLLNVQSIRENNLNLFRGQVPKYEGNVYAAARDVAMNSSRPLGLEAASIYTKQAAATDKQYSDGSYEVSNIKNFVPLDQVGFNMSGITEENRQGITKHANWDLLNKRNKLWNSQDVQAKVLPGGHAISDNYDAFNVSYLYMPYKQVNKYMNDADIVLSGGEVVTRSFDEISTSRTDKFDYAGNPDGSTVVTRGKSEPYVRFPVASLIPSEGQAAMEADAVYNKYISLSSGTKDTQAAKSQRDRATIYE